jgi:DNA-directed RNA polymerase specialized sigma24 family protein
MERQWRGSATDPALAANNGNPARKVDPDAERFVQVHRPRVLNYLTASGYPVQLSEEIVNDSALVMVNRWDRLHTDGRCNGADRGEHAGRAGAGARDDDVGLRTYMFKTAIHLMYRHGPRERQWREDLVLDAPDGLHLAEESDHAPLMQDLVIDQLMAYEIVHQALPRLAPPYRQVLWLRHAEDFSTCVTAHILRIPENTVKTQLRVGVRLFKDHVKAVRALTGTDPEEAL